MTKKVIPDCTQELVERVEANADALVAIGVKEWMKRRKKKANMSELEQKEAVRKLEEKLLDGKRKEA